MPSVTKLLQEISYFKNRLEPRKLLVKFLSFASFQHFIQVVFKMRGLYVLCYAVILQEDLIIVFIYGKKLAAISCLFFC